jgi:cytochrome c-type biogenesis protein
MESFLERLVSLHGVGILLGFLGGFVSFFSPCIFPLIPVYFSFLAGTSVEGINRGVLLQRVALLCSGFTFIFVLLGASATAFGNILLAHRSILRIVGGLIVIMLALETTGLVAIPVLHRNPGFRFPKTASTFSAVLLGAVLAFSWTPCVGPVLAAILTAASLQESVSRGTVLLFSYSLGLSLPFFFLAFFVSRQKRWQAFLTRHHRKVRITAGIVLLLFGFYLLRG